MYAISPASRADITEVSGVLGSAFAEDTVMGTLVRGDHRAAKLRELFKALIDSGPLESGRVDIARRDGDGRILGAAIWEEPGHRGSLFAKAAQLPGFLRSLGLRGLRPALKVQQALAHHRPTAPHWYLAQIGVGEHARGEGVGSSLLEYGLARASREGQPAYLEASNSRNRALYGRHGFTPISTIAGVPNAAPTAMWRDSV